MVGLWNFVASLFIFIPLLGGVVVNGFALKNNKDLKLLPPLTSPTSSLASSSTEQQQKPQPSSSSSDIDVKTQQQQQSSHRVPLDILTRDKRSSSSDISLVKREVDLMDEEQVNGMMPYDQSLMYMPKRTALGISKILLAPFYEPNTRTHNSMYESQLEPLNKERNIQQPSAMYFNQFQDGIKREGQKGAGSSRKYFKCFFNAVSCFRKK